MEKPLILEIHDFTEELTQVINKYTSSVPLTVMADKLDNMHRIVSEQAGVQYKAVYEKYTKESEVETDG